MSEFFKGFELSGGVFLCGGEGFFLVVGLLATNEAVDEAGEFMRNGGGGFGFAEAGFHTATVVAHGAFCVGEALGGHAERSGDSVDDSASFTFKNFAS